MASNAGGMGKNRDSRPILASSRVVDGLNAKFIHALRWTVAGWRQSSLIAISGVVCCSRETDNEVFMTRNLNVTPKTTVHLFVRIGNSEAAITNNSQGKLKSARRVTLLKLTRQTGSITRPLCGS